MRGETMSLRAEDLSVTYELLSGSTLTAIETVDLNVEDKEFVTLIGPSGCGKSTLLSCLGGLARPSSGRVTLAGTELTRPVPENAAMVFQEYSLLPWKSVLDNVAIGLRFAGVPKRERLDRALSQLELVGLKEFAGSYPSELSGGMQQRVSIARALAMDPAMLLLDEPFGALDELTRRELGAEMAEILTRTGKMVVLVTHSLDEAIYWGDRVLVMSSRPGRITSEIRIEQARPRRLEFLTSPEADGARARLLDMLTSSARGEEYEETSSGRG